MTLLYLNSDEMGRGGPELGRKLRDLSRVLYGRSETLQIGEVGDMGQSVQAMATADRVIRPN